MKELIASVLIYGDMHLCSKSYGAHRDYPRESLEYFHNITEVAKEVNATHIIGLGDFTYGRFNTLEYRKAVEDELAEQNKITSGNRFELFGNHDTAGYGMTEYQYYVEKGMLKTSQGIRVGNLNIQMVDYVDQRSTTFEEAPETNIEIIDGCTNVVLTHNYVRFKDTQMASFGGAAYLDNFSKWYGVDYIICGHVHKQYIFDGPIISSDGTRSHRATVQYLGCMMRPAYREDLIDKEGLVVNLRAFSDGSVTYDVISLPLWDIAESFNLEKKEKEKDESSTEKSRVDISDIVKRLNESDRRIGNPVDIVMGLENVNEKYRSKALQLLELAVS